MFVPIERPQELRQNRPKRRLQRFASRVVRTTQMFTFAPLRSHPAELQGPFFCRSARNATHRLLRASPPYNLRFASAIRRFDPSRPSHLILLV
jgi:hypothetical protein